MAIVSIEKAGDTIPVWKLKVFMLESRRSKPKDERSGLFHLLKGINFGYESILNIIK